MTDKTKEKAKAEAKQLFEEFYQILFEQGGELADEILISILSIKTAVLAVERIIRNNKSHDIQLNMEKGVTDCEFWEIVKQELLEL